jgi:hypothetical protein
VFTLLAGFKVRATMRLTISQAVILSTLGHHQWWEYGYIKSKSKLCYNRWSVGQSVLMSEAPIWGPDFYCCKTVVGLLMGVPSLMRGRSLPVQSVLGPSSLGLTTIIYFLGFETLPTWRSRSLYLYYPPPKNYLPRHWVLFLSSLMTHRAMVEVFKPASTLPFPTPSQP